MDSNTIISARGVKRRYVMGKTELYAIGGLDLDIYRGEYFSIMGPSGSGKSTLFNLIGGLDTPTEGEILIDGVSTGSMNERQIAYLRCRKIGFIFQTFNLIEVLSALENVALPLIFGGMSDEEAHQVAAETLDKVGLEGRHSHLPGQLSGGQQQRVACARALANKPRILLADEPTGNLDLKTGENIIRMLSELKEDLGITIISATHDHKMLAASDRVLFLEDGLIKDIKTKDQLSISLGQIDGETS